MSLLNFFHDAEKAAAKAGIALQDAFLFLSHLAAHLTPIAVAVETVVTGNAELVPITNAVNSAVQTVNEVVQTDVNPAVQNPTIPLG